MGINFEAFNLVRLRNSLIILIEIIQITTKTIGLTIQSQVFNDDLHFVITISKKGTDKNNKMTNTKY